MENQWNHNMFMYFPELFSFWRYFFHSCHYFSSHFQSHFNIHIPKTSHENHFPKRPQSAWNRTNPCTHEASPAHWRRPPGRLKRCASNGNMSRGYGTNGQLAYVCVYGGCPKYLFPDSPQSLSQSRSNRGTTVSNRGRVCSSLIRSYT